MAHYEPATPWRSIVPWILAAVAGAAGLVLGYGFTTPPVEQADQVTWWLLVSCLGLFAVSRLLMLVPASGLARRLGRWWVDDVLIIAAAAWWIINPEAESFILHAGAAYVLVVGAAAMVRSGIGALAEGLPGRRAGSVGLLLVCILLGLVLVGGALLTLPVCSRGGRAVEADHSLAWYQLKLEYLDNTFTAAAALTGTGLSVQNIGYHYNRVGQTVVLVLMEIGGLGILAVGAIAAMHFRRLLGWGSITDEISPAALRRLVLFIWLFALAAQAVGAAGIYRMWDPAVDPNFKTAQAEPALLADWVRAHTSWAGSYDEARIFASVFHSVSAFTDCGLTLTRDGYLPYRNLPGPLLAILPLVFLGSLGGPVILELLQRMTRRRDMGLEAVSRDTWVTLGGSALVLLLGAAVLFGIESTRDYQQRYPRENTPGRLLVNGGSTQPSAATWAAGTQAHGPATQPAEQAPIEFSAATSGRAQGERLSGMTTRNRVRAALFQAEAARAGGARSARLDEGSLSPASHLAMMGLMLIGGGVGGAAGGLRVVVVVVLLASMLSGGFAFRGTHSQARSTLGADWGRAVAMGAGIATGMLLLIALVSMALLYLESGTALACMFEAVSACCNAGLSVGLTADLSITGRIVLALGMILGRLLPLLILMRAIAGRAPLTKSRSTEREHRRADDDAPIPLE